MRKKGVPPRAATRPEQSEGVSLRRKYKTRGERDAVKLTTSEATCPEVSSLAWMYFYLD
jgi:hypothetical protein